MGTPQFWNTEIRVSGPGDNDEPHITALADGRFVVTWVDNDAQEIRAQILNADGSPRGSQFTIGSAQGEQMHPNIVSLADGRFVVVWTDQRDPRYDDNEGSAPGDQADIFAQIFDIDGTPLDLPFQVNIGTPPAHGLFQPSVTALENGGFAIAWRDYLTSDDPGNAHAGVRFVRYNSDGSPADTPRLIDTSTHYTDVRPAILELEGGNLVIAWTEGTATNETILVARIVDPDGYTAKDLGEIGAPFDGVADVVQSTPEITRLADGGFVVTWKVNDGSTGAQDYAVWARVFDADGTPRTDAFEICPPNNVEVDPVVTALKDGRFIVSWAQFGMHGHGSPAEIRAQVFTADGVKDGDTFTVNAPAASTTDMMPRITTLEDGRVAVVWWHDSEPTIRVRIIDPREDSIVLAGTDFDDDYVGTSFNDTLQGGVGNDQFDGGAGADVIDGGEGFDTVTFAHASSRVVVSLSGGTAGDASGDTYTSIERLIGSRYNDIFYGNGASELRGGAGNDTYYVVNSGDKVVETSSGGTDTIYTKVSFALSAYVENLIAQGSASINLTGNSSANTIIGNKGRNTIKGGSGNDKLYGGYGNDTLYGGSGKDVFVFDSKLGTHKTDRKVNFDTIKDFSVKDDSIWLDNAIFKKLGKKGSASKPAKLNKKFFTIGDKAKDKDDYIIYNKKTGVLMYDADGSGKGKAIEIAQLKKGLKLTYSDFFVI